MIQKRTIAYIIILVSFYTFLTVFSVLLDFIDIYLTTVIITILSYSWVLYSASRQGPVIVDYMDVVAQIFLYCFISLFIGFGSLLFFGFDFEPIRILILVLPVIVWTAIWTDIYFQRLKGKM